MQLLSVSNLTLQETGSPNGGLSNVSSNFILNKLPNTPGAQKIGSTDASAYMYKFFRTNLSASFGIMEQYHQVLLYQLRILLIMVLILLQVLKQ